MLRFGVAMMIIVGLSVWRLTRVHREYHHRRSLSTLSVFEVWVLYLFHFGATVAASVVAGIWSFPLRSIKRRLLPFGSKRTIESLKIPISDTFMTNIYNIA